MFETNIHLVDLAMSHLIEFNAFLAPCERVLVKSVVYVPDTIIKGLPSAGRIRTEGTMNGAPFALAIQSFATGERYFAVSARLRKEACIEVGDEVVVKCSVVDPDALVLPDELQALLDVDDDGRTVWNSLTRGRQRGLVHYIGSAKGIDVRIRRAIDIIERAKRGELYSQETKKRRASM